jgi:hypothetical protein
MTKTTTQSPRLIDYHMHTAVTIVGLRDNAFIVAPIGAPASKTSKEEENNG